MTDKCEKCKRGRTGLYHPCDFEIPPELEQKLTDWIAARPPMNDGPIEARYAFGFIPSTIGTEITVIDRFTKDRLDLTEDVEW